MSEFQEQFKTWCIAHLQDWTCPVCKAPASAHNRLETPLMMDEVDPATHKINRGHGQDFAVLICTECGHSLFVNTDQMKPF